MHVLLNVLLAIGIILLIILSIIIILGLLILFVPARYRIKAEFDNDAVIDYRLSWLAGIISYSGGHNEDGGTLRVFGFRVGRRNEKKPVKKDSKTAAKNYRKNHEELPKDNNDTKPDEANKSGNFKASKVKTKKCTANPLKRIIHRFKRTIVNIKRSIRGLINEDNKRLLIFCKDMLVYIIKHIRPKKIKAELTIGCEEPAYTGLVFGVLGIITTFWKGKYRFTPDFENAVLKGYITAKGKIRGITALKCIIKIIRNEDIKKLINRKG